MQECIMEALVQRVSYCLARATQLNHKGKKFQIALGEVVIIKAQMRTMGSGLLEQNKNYLPEEMEWLEKFS